MLITAKIPLLNTRRPPCEAVAHPPEIYRQPAPPEAAADPQADMRRRLYERIAQGHAMKDAEETAEQMWRD